MELLRYGLFPFPVGNKAAGSGSTNGLGAARLAQLSRKFTASKGTDNTLKSTTAAATLMSYAQWLRAATGHLHLQPNLAKL